MLFSVTIGLKEVGRFTTFPEAFRVFFEKVKEQVAQGTSLQVLETMNFVILHYLGREVPMYFYDARDLAYRLGLVKDGQLVEPAPDVSTEDFVDAFYNACRRSIKATLAAKAERAAQED